MDVYLDVDVVVHVLVDGFCHASDEKGLQEDQTSAVSSFEDLM